MMSIDKVVGELIEAVVELTAEVRALRELLSNAQSDKPKPKAKSAADKAKADEHHRQLYDEVKALATNALNLGLSKERVRAMIVEAGGDKLSALTDDGLVKVAGTLEKFIAEHSPES